MSKVKVVAAHFHSAILLRNIGSVNSLSPAKQSNIPMEYDTEDQVLRLSKEGINYIIPSTSIQCMELANEQATEAKPVKLAK